MVALSAENFSKVKFHLGYSYAVPAEDMARLYRACNEVADSWTLTRIGELIVRCESAYALTELDAGTLFSETETAVTGDIVRTVANKAKDPWNRRARYYLETTNYLAKALGVRNYRDPSQAEQGYLIDGGLFINSIPGPPGNDGVDGSVWRGAWDAATNYVANDSVHYQGSAYIANADNLNKTPGTDPEWDLWVSKGEQGEQGLPGADGADGIDGLPGAGVLWRSAWNVATNYAEFDAVEYNGSSYIANAANVGKTPGTDPEWDLWVEKGNTGSAGADGAGIVNDILTLPHAATPSDPGAGNTAVYAKSDGKLYVLPTGGSETEVGSGSGGGASLSDIWLYGGF